jgi:hypothetical protein
VSRPESSRSRRIKNHKPQCTNVHEDLGFLIQRRDRTLWTDTNYIVIYLSFEGIGDDMFSNEESFTSGFVDSVSDILFRLNYTDQAILWKEQIDNIKTFKHLSMFITQFIVKFPNKKIVLIIDEVDRSSNSQIFLSFMGMLRYKYLQTDSGFDSTFQSVILGGVHDVKTIKLKIAPDSSGKMNSPWNIAVDFNIDMTFHPKEIETMLTDYVEETKADMNIPAIAEKIYYYTSGYPYLVSKICKVNDEIIIPLKEQLTWDEYDIDKAFKYLVDESYSTTLFDNIIKNLENNSDLYKFVFKITINGILFTYNINEPVTYLALQYGIIKNDNGICSIHNRIFEQRIYNYMIAKTIVAEKNVTFPESYGQYYVHDELNIPFILERFQRFMKENYLKKDNKFIEREGRLIFLSFLKPIINGKGFDFKEPAVGDERRVDIVVTFNDKRYVIELKNWYGDHYHQKGLKQLSDYLDNYSLKKGYLLIFNFNQNKTFKTETISFEDKELYAVWV